MSRRPTITDVAARAGVSKSTVSLVLQGSPQVRTETRQGVERAMAEIGYVYNRAAANLRSASGGLIGLVINDLRDPFYAAFAASLQMALADEGHAMIIASSDEDAERQEACVGSMIENGVSAIVIVPAHGAAGAAVARLERAGRPVMQVLRRMDERTDLFPFASFDYAAGSARATRHLLQMGARNVAFVGGLPGRPVTRDRKSGWREVLKTEALEEVALHGKSTRGFGMEMAETLIADHPDVDAALCFNDAVASGLMTGLQRVGRVVGRDIRIVGFGDAEETAQGWPPLSSVACDMPRFAAETAARLLSWTRGEGMPEPDIRSPVRLVQRVSSTGESG